MLNIPDDPDSAWWWEALRAGSLLLPKCGSCHNFYFPPIGRCPECGYEHFEQITACGRGSIYSWVVIHHAFDEEFASDVPAVIAAVDLDEGPRILVRLVGQSVPTPGGRVRAVQHSVNGVVVPAVEMESYHPV